MKVTLLAFSNLLAALFLCLVIYQISLASFKTYASLLKSSLLISSERINLNSSFITTVTTTFWLLPTVWLIQSIPTVWVADSLIHRTSMYFIAISPSSCFVFSSLTPCLFYCLLILIWPKPNPYWPQLSSLQPKLFIQGLAALFSLKYRRCAASEPSDFSIMIFFSFT